MSQLELVCPAGTPAALRAAVDNGADAVYLGFRDATNARNFPGLNFSRPELQQSLAYAHQADCKIFLAINTFPKAGEPEPWRQAIDDGATLGVDALIIADIGLLDYASRKHPDMRRHCRSRRRPPIRTPLASIKRPSTSNGWFCRASSASPRSPH